jgi:hypothetical protein
LLFFSFFSPTPSLSPPRHTQAHSRVDFLVPSVYIEPERLRALAGRAWGKGVRFVRLRFLLRPGSRWDLELISCAFALSKRLAGGQKMRLHSLSGACKSMSGTDIRQQMRLAQACSHAHNTYPPPQGIHWSCAGVVAPSYTQPFTTCHAWRSTPRTTQGPGPWLPCKQHPLPRPAFGARPCVRLLTARMAFARNFPLELR